MNTFSAKPSDITHEWHVVDAQGVPLGRLASHVAQGPVGQLIDVSKSPARGREDAIVTLIEFSDYECSFCAGVEPTIPAVVNVRKSLLSVALANMVSPLAVYKIVSSDGALH